LPVVWGGEERVRGSDRVVEGFAERAVRGYDSVQPGSPCVRG
jgi:hypothetical protein